MDRSTLSVSRIKIWCLIDCNFTTYYFFYLIQLYVHVCTHVSRLHVLHSCTREFMYVISLPVMVRWWHAQKSLPYFIEVFWLQLCTWSTLVLKWGVFWANYYLNKPPLYLVRDLVPVIRRLRYCWKHWRWLSTRDLSKGNSQPFFGCQERDYVQYHDQKVHVCIQHQNLWKKVERGTRTRRTKALLQVQRLLCCESLWQEMREVRESKLVWNIEPCLY